MGVGGGWAKAVAPSPAPLCSINRLSNNRVQYYQMFSTLTLSYMACIKLTLKSSETSASLHLITSDFCEEISHEEC